VAQPPSSTLRSGKVIERSEVNVRFVESTP